MNTPISFPLAKLLKEKGFDESCNHIFDNGHQKYLGAIQRKNSTYEHIITRPTIAEVVMWLYEKHGIWISIVQNEYEDKFQYTLTKRKLDSWNIIDNGKLFNSPTKAYEAAIEYTLNNLI